jgi:2-keto-3-deoxy-L-rhamnonate aldolase RhmA
MENRRIRLAGWLSLADPLVAEAAGRAGYDWVGIDLQHGAWDVGSAARGVQLLDLLNVPVLVRVAEEELPLIPHVLDQGASGIVVAMVSSPEAMKAAVRRARYHPEGSRSYGGQRYGMRHEPQDPATVRPAVHAMIETRVALDKIDTIASVPDLGGIHVGPVDLGLSLGFGMNRSSGEFEKALRKIVQASHAAGLPAVMHAVTSAQIRPMIELGFDELVLTADVGLLQRAFAEDVAAARAAIEVGRATPHGEKTGEQNAGRCR